MNNLINIINYTKILEEFIEINANIISESLNCKLLQELAQQLQTQKKDTQERIDKEYEEDKKRSNYAYKRSNYSKNFKEIFGRSNIAWSDILDSDISYIPKFDINDKHSASLIRQVIKGNSKIILTRNPKTKIFIYFIDTWGRIFSLSNVNYEKSGEQILSRSGRSWKDLNQSEKINLCKDQDIYFINCSVAQGNASQKNNDRHKSREGMIFLDPDSLRDMARRNVERYKEIVRKNKANRINNDELLNNIKKAIQQAATFATMVAKDPVRHADLIADVSKLTTWIYDERRYISNGNRPGYYSGVNGLLPTMMKYTKLVQSIAKDGGYSHEETSLNNAQTELKKAYEECMKLIEQIDSKLDE